MIQFTKTDSKENLVSAINAIQPTASVGYEFLNPVKELTIDLLRKVTQPKAYVSINVGCIATVNAQQVGIQVTGRDV